MSKARSHASPSFFKVLIGDFGNRMCFPPAFTKNFNGNVPKTCFLTTSNRRTWTISVEKVDEELFLCNEWPTFVKDNALEFGEFLLFIYKGNSVFHVKIFGKNCCEKELSLGRFESVKKEKQVFDDTPNQETAGVTDKMRSTSLRPNIRAANTTPCEDLEVAQAIIDPNKKYQMSLPLRFAIENGLTEVDDVVLIGPSHMPWPVKLIHKSRGTTILGSGWVQFCKSNNVDKDDVFQFELVQGTGTTIKVDILRSTKVTQEPKISRNEVSENSYLIAKPKTRLKPHGFASENPYCFITMRSTYVQGYFPLILPRSFAREYLKEESRDATLRASNGDTWHAQYNVGKDHYTLTRGWKKFASDNHLKPNDVCIFELVDQNDLEFKVSIIPS